MKIIIKKILFFLIKKILEKHRPMVVGITGSVGKTSTKDLIWHVLKNKKNIMRNVGNYNTEYGLPLAIIGAKSPGFSIIGWLSVLAKGFKTWFGNTEDFPKLLILEMGANHPGDIEWLCKMTSPSVGVVTAVAPTHLAFFGTIKKVAKEKRALVASLTQKSFAILNFDDAEVREMAKSTKAKIISYGFAPDAEVRASDVRHKTNSETGFPEGVFFKISYNGNMVPVYLNGIIGQHLIYSSLAATAVALSFGLNLVEITDSLKSAEFPPGRMRLLPGIKGTMIVDDSYNASPVSTIAAIKSLKQIDMVSGRRFAALGDMLELGDSSEESHKTVGMEMRDGRVDYFLAIGPLMRVAAREAIAGGMPEDRVILFDDSLSAGKFLQDKIKGGDVILIKGSRGTHMEKAVKEIMAEPMKANELLVRVEH